MTACTGARHEYPRAVLSAVVADLRAIAQMRLREAEVLLANGEPSGAYYLAGYAVECAFKAVITRSFAPYEMPPKKRVADSYIHDLTRLAEIAGLNGALDAQMAADASFAAGWGVAKDWSEASRYEQLPQRLAADMVAAVADPTSGVLAWISRFW